MRRPPPALSGLSPAPRRGAAAPRASRSRRRSLVALAAAVVLHAGLAPAQEGTRLGAWEGDTWLLWGSLGVWGVTELGVKSLLAPERCRWCAPSGFDADVRNALVWQDDVAADVASYVTLAGEPILGFTALSLAARPGEAAQNAEILGQVYGVVGVATNLVKFSVGRQRPVMRFHGSRWESVPDNDANLSFFSGHASLAFAGAVGAGTIASMREYPEAPWIWGVGLPLAVGTAYLRIAADAHYLSDVTTGALVGAAGGALVPLLLHPRQPGPVVAIGAVPLAEGGVATTYSGRW